MIYDPTTDSMMENPDVKIVQQLDQLKQEWRTTVPPEKKIHWKSKWQTSPPSTPTKDYKIPYTPPIWNATQVDDATAYAWEFTYKQRWELLYSDVDPQFADTPDLIIQSANLSQRDGLTGTCDLTSYPYGSAWLWWFLSYPSTTPYSVPPTCTYFAGWSYITTSSTGLPLLYYGQRNPINKVGSKATLTGCIVGGGGYPMIWGETTELTIVAP
jgi:hypothetical protein